jgi:hypothetical protein
MDEKGVVQQTMKNLSIVTSVVVFAFGLALLSGCERQAPAAQEEETATETVQVEAPDAPAGKGEPLPEVISPPRQTIGMISADAAEAGSTYRIVFRPYGSGPGRSTLVVFVEESEPDGTAESAYPFAQKNVLVRCSDESAVTEGGLYEGTLKLVPEAETLRPMLADVTQVDQD